MNAVRIHEYGHEDVLSYETAPIPAIQDDDVLIRVMAASVNPLDWKIREGHMKKRIQHEFPLILGWDVSGVIESTGSKVSQFRKGDEVYTRPDLSRNGSYAEYIVVKADEAALKPETLNHAEAASIPLAGITAWQALVEVANISRGDSLLVHGASGGVGSLAVQIANAKGAYVFGTTSRNVDLLEELGVNHVINYAEDHFCDMIANVDVVLDTVGGKTQEDSWSVLGFGGTLVSIVSPPSQEKAEDANAHGAYFFARPNAKYLVELAKLLDSGEIRPVIGHEFPLEDIQEAHKISQLRHARGKIVIHVASE